MLAELHALGLRVSPEGLQKVLAELPPHTKQTPSEVFRHVRLVWAEKQPHSKAKEGH